MTNSNLRFELPVIDSLSSFFPAQVTEKIKPNEFIPVIGHIFTFLPSSDC